MKRIRGKVLLVDGREVFVARGRHIYRSQDHGESWQRFTSIPVPILARFIYRTHLLMRLLRRGCHHLLKRDHSSYYLIFDRAIFVIGQGRCEYICPTVGSRPLCVAVKNGSLFYGEYRSNPDRSPVHVFRVDISGRHESVIEFSDVRHIHGVFFDPVDQSMWVTTGDYGDEAGIWRHREGTLEKVLSGSQQTRAVQLLFDADAVYFGTDTPLDDNHIYSFSRSGGSLKRHASVSSSVFYGVSPSDGFLFLATVAEPSTRNETRIIELWGRPPAGDWTRLLSFRKDLFPMKLFQYGQVCFPAVTGDSPYLWLYLQGVVGSGNSIRLKVADLFGTNYAA